MSIPNTSRRCIAAYIRSIVFVLYFAVSVVLIVLAWSEIQTQADIIKSLEASVSTQNERIVKFEAENERLNQEISSAALEKAVSRGKERTAVITAYTWTGSKTASGTWPKEGRTVAGPRNIPFGTVVWIDGIGERVVEDRTHKRYDGRYDVYMDSKSDCIKWGIQERVIR